MRLFNAIQIVALFALWPFLLVWLSNGATFPGRELALVVGVVIYLCGCCAIVGAIYESIADWG